MRQFADLWHEDQVQETATQVLQPLKESSDRLWEIKILHFAVNIINMNST